MYILVDNKTDIIVGTASQKVDNKSCSDSGYRVFEIPNDQFNFSMLGKKLTGYEKV
jgi:hypothetical protein